MKRRIHGADREASDIEKVSHWLSWSVFTIVQAAIEQRDDPEIHRWKHDTRDRLAMGLEAYALLLLGKAPDRVRLLIRELEMNRNELRHRKALYFDPIESREIHRSLARMCERWRKSLQVLEAKGDSLTTDEKREVRQLRRSIEQWDRQFGP